MLIKVVGSRNLDFKDDNGNNIKGKQYAFLYEDNRITGYWIDKFFVAETVKMPLEIIPGHDYDVNCYYRSNRFDFSTLRLVK